MGADRMQKEITALAPSTIKIKIIAPPERKYSSGSEAPSWPPCPPSSRCGSASRSMTSPAPALSTGSASNLFLHLGLAEFEVSHRLGVHLQTNEIFSST